MAITFSITYIFAAFLKLILVEIFNLRLIKLNVN